MTKTDKKQSQLNSFDLLELETQFFANLRSLGRSQNTLKNYKTDLECFNQYLKKNQDGLKIDHFKTGHIEEYGNYLQTRYSSDNSRRRRVQALRIFFDFLVEKKLFESNPVRKIPTSPKFLDIPRPASFSHIKTAWEHLLEESQSKNTLTSLTAKRNLMMLLLIYGAGLKISDLTIITTKDIHIPDNDDAEPRVLVHPRKRDPYTVTLPKVFIPIYKDYIEDLNDAKKLSHLTFDKLLFNANAYRIINGGLSPRGIEMTFEDLRSKLMIEITAKSLRQSCIFKWLKQNKKDSIIKEWLGLSPSYNLKLYKDHLKQHVFDDGFLYEIYKYYKKKDFSKA
tara:strand:- start:11835 stop:12848 length:1014 start_codon:yes stop_codon:yes gene_type:complete